MSAIQGAAVKKHRPAGRRRRNVALGAIFGPNVALQNISFIWGGLGKTWQDLARLSRPGEGGGISILLPEGLIGRQIQQTRDL
jgi:hypothetical protein